MLLYLNNLTSYLPHDLAHLIVKGSYSNPRKAKRIINLLYFLTHTLEENEFYHTFPLLVIWCILTLVFPNIARILRHSPIDLIDIIAICLYYNTFYNFTKNFQNLNFNDLRDNNPTIYYTPNVYVAASYLTQYTRQCLNVILNNRNLFDFLKECGKYFKIDEQINEIKKNPPNEMEGVISEFHNSFERNVNHIIQKTLI
jgi:hypothetical protein